jgi:hypothetical protein
MHTAMYIYMVELIYTLPANTSSTCMVQFIHPSIHQSMQHAYTIRVFRAQPAVVSQQSSEQRRQLKTPRTGRPESELPTGPPRTALATTWRRPLRVDSVTRDHVGIKGEISSFPPQSPPILIPMSPKVAALPPQTDRQFRPPPL